MTKELRIEHVVLWNQDFAHSLSLFLGVVEYRIGETGYVRSLNGKMSSNFLVTPVGSTPTCTGESICILDGITRLHYLRLS